MPEVRLTITEGGNVLQATTAWFTVSWVGVPDPKYDDWIALYVPGNANVSTTAPTKLKYATEAATHMANGSGSVRFKLFNYHQDVRFSFMRGGLAAPVRVADSLPVHMAHINQPTQVHLALTTTPGEMSVQWVTWNARAPAVQWGRTPDVMALTAPAVSTTIRPEDLCGSVAATIGWVDPGTLHAATMTDLRPGVRYFYRVGDPEGGWSDVRSFLTPPAPGNGYRHSSPMRAVGPSALQQRMLHAESHGGMGGAYLRRLGTTYGALPDAVDGPAPGDPTVRVLLVADMGQGEQDGSNSIQEGMSPSLNTSRLLLQEGPSFSLLLHPGDLAYARGYQSLWDNFLVQMEPVASRMPYMVQPGNHERDWPGTGDRFDSVEDSWGECGVPYARRLKMPTSSWDAMWYSFDHGPIHFLAYSTEHPTEPGSPQHAFIAADLASVDRSITPWVVVLGHRPLYVSSSNDAPPDGDLTIAAQLKADLEPLLLTHKVDLVVSGHHHTYQRTCPLANGTCVGYDAAGAARGPVFIVLGNGGAGLTLALAQPPPAFLERLVVWWGYARLEASRARLRFEAISDLDGGLIDAVVLRK